jgi:hypothetical protein
VGCRQARGQGDREAEWGACRRLDLAFAGETSQFATKVPIQAPGDYEVIVFAHDPRNGNTGLDRTTFIATKD